MNPKTMPAEFKARWHTSKSSVCHVETCLTRVVLMAGIHDSSWALTPAGFRKEWKLRPMKTGYHPGSRDVKNLTVLKQSGLKNSTFHEEKQLSVAKTPSRHCAYSFPLTRPLLSLNWGYHRLRLISKVTTSLRVSFGSSLWVTLLGSFRFP